ncbi:MAG TPA: TIM barrel protein [Gemmatimonadaceae bacterium]
MPDRREFLRQVAGAAVTGALAPISLAGEASVRADEIKFGCAAITWGGNDEHAIDDISALGYAGIQLRTSVLKAYADRPAALRDLLATRHLTFVALSSGNVPIDPAVEEKVIDEHLAHARFLRQAGGLYLQLIDERPRGRAVEPGDYVRLGNLLTEIGKRVAEVGVQAVYHPHMGSIGEKPADIDRVLDATDPKYVPLLFDVAHYQAGGGDPVRAIHRYAGRIALLHIKDLRQPAHSAPFQFVELGRGSVDLRGIFAALRAERFKGWAIVELDSVPEAGLSPKEAAAISKRYLEEKIGARIS